jgi:succinoglycan biosynthesis transport protein ExoP
METQTNASPSAFGPVVGVLDFSRLLHIVLRRLWLPMLFSMLTIGAGVAYLMTRPISYSALVVVQVEQQAQRIVNFPDGSPDEDFRSAEVLKTFEQVLGSGSLLLRVVKANHLDTNPSFAPPKPNHAPYSDGELIERMSRKVTVAIRRGTRLIDITVTDPDPALVSRLARSMVDEYRNLDIEQKLDVSSNANAFLLTEEKKLKEALEASESQLADYRLLHQAVSLEEKQNIVVEKLRELNQQVTEVKSKRLALESDIAKINGGSVKSDQLLQLASINTVSAVADLRRQINEKEGEFAAIKERYMYKHIKYIAAESSLQKLRAALEQEIDAAAAVLNRTYQSVRETEAKLENALHDQEQEALKLDKTAIPYRALMRQTETNRTLYENVLTRMKQAGVTRGSGSSDLRLVQEPTTPYHADRLSRTKVLGLALAAGIFLGFAAILALEMLNHTLQTVDQAEHILGLPLLVAVPELRRRWRGVSVPLVGAEEAPQREAFRTLRTTLAMFKDRETRSFLFTSAVPSEGKSFCSLNFASTLAQGGCHTLLLNADLRRPSNYATVLDCKEKPGLSECLAGKLQFAQVCHQTKVQNLFLCPAGERSGEPADLLAGKRLGEVMREALQVFDRVVIDSPPINAVSDCLVLAAYVEAVCLVLRARSTPVNAILRACRTFLLGGVTPVGFIINRMSARLGAKSTHYAYGSEYHQAERKSSQPQ